MRSGVCLVGGICWKGLRSRNWLQKAGNSSGLFGNLSSFVMEPMLGNTTRKPVPSASHGCTKSLPPKMVHDSVTTEVVVPCHMRVALEDLVGFWANHWFKGIYNHSNFVWALLVEACRSRV